MCFLQKNKCLATKQTMNGSEGIFLCTIQKNFEQLKTFKGSYIPESHYDNRMEVMEMVKVLSCQVKWRHWPSTSRRKILKLQSLPKLSTPLKYPMKRLEYFINYLINHKTHYSEFRNELWRLIIWFIFSSVLKKHC